VVSDHVVNQVHRCVLGGIVLMSRDETTHAREPIHEGQNAVVGSCVAQVGFRESHCPVHVQVLPAEVGSADDLSVSPSCPFHRPIPLESHTGENKAVNVGPHPAPIEAFLDSGRCLVTPTVARHCRVV